MMDYSKYRPVEDIKKDEKRYGIILETAEDCAITALIDLMAYFQREPTFEELQLLRDEVGNAFKEILERDFDQEIVDKQKEMM